MPDNPTVMLHSPKLAKPVVHRQCLPMPHFLASAWIFCTMWNMSGGLPLKIHPLWTHTIIKKSGYILYIVMDRLFHVFCIVSFTLSKYICTEDNGQIVWNLWCSSWDILVYIVKVDLYFSYSKPPISFLRLFVSVPIKQSLKDDLFIHVLILLRRRNLTKISMDHANIWFKCCVLSCTWIDLVNATP